MNKYNIQLNIKKNDYKRVRQENLPPAAISLSLSFCIFHTSTTKTTGDRTQWRQFRNERIGQSTLCTVKKCRGTAYHRTNTGRTSLDLLRDEIADKLTGSRLTIVYTKSCVLSFIRLVQYRQRFCFSIQEGI